MLTFSDNTTDGGVDVARRTSEPKKRRPKKSKSIIDRRRPRNLDKAKILLKFDNVFFNVVDKSGNTREILRGLSGYAREGELIAIMGSSGAGKTTLFNIISGRQKNNAVVTVIGDLNVENKTYTLGPNEIDYDVAYVMQIDLLTPTFTVFEQFRFSARLRLPSFLDEIPIRERAEEMCGIMGLKRAKDSLIGDERIPGISGGQKKRVAVGSELIPDPNFLFLDEPTSGLDSHSALSLCKTLSELAKKGHCVIVVIHQPSAECFCQFDTLWLLSQGKFVYNGPLGDVGKYFLNVAPLEKYMCPKGTNIADHLITCIHHDETDPDESKKRIDFFIDKWDEQIAIQEELRQKEGSKIIVHSTKADNRTRSTVNGIKSTGSKPGMGMQFWELFKRDIIELKRNPMLTRVKVVQVIFTALFASFIFFQIDQNYPEGVQNIGGALFFCMMSLTMMLTSNTVLTFPLAKAVFERERKNKMYMTTPFFFSKWLVSLLEIILAVPFSLITKYMMGLQMEYFTYLLFCMVFCFIAGAQGTTLGAVAPDAQTAVQMIPIAIIPFVMMAGFLVSLDSITWALRWIGYVDLFKYGFESLSLFEFHNNWYECQETSSIVNGTSTAVSVCPEYSEANSHFIRCKDGGTDPDCFKEYSGTYYVTGSLNMEYDARWSNFFVLISLGLGFRLIGYGVLVKDNGW